MEKLERERRSVKAKARTTTSRKNGRESAIKGGRKTAASTTVKRGRKVA